MVRPDLVARLQALADRNIRRFDLLGDESGTAGPSTVTATGAP